MVKIGDITDVQNALIAHVKAIEDPNNAGEFADAGKAMSDCAFTDEALPYFWVRRGRLLRRTRTEANVYEYVREYTLLLYVARFCNAADTADDDKQGQAANWVDPFHTSFRYRMPTPLGAAFEIMNATDLGDVDLHGINAGDVYAGQIFILQIKTMRTC